MNEKINDFGFTSEPEFQQDVRLKKVEDLILPLLKKLIDSSPDSIKWPNRKEPLEALVKQILEITRS